MENATYYDNRDMSEMEKYHVARIEVLEARIETLVAVITRYEESLREEVNETCA